MGKPPPIAKDPDVSHLVAWIGDESIDIDIADLPEQGWTVIDVKDWVCRGLHPPDRVSIEVVWNHQHTAGMGDPFKGKPVL
ncbi:MAG: hypothetical protein AAGJ50_16070 [Pseudomonadota bacterium]